MRFLTTDKFCSATLNNDELESNIKYNFKLYMIWYNDRCKSIYSMDEINIFK